VKISGFRVYRFELPLVAPLVLAGETIRVREGLLLELVGEGLSGWGETSPLPGFSGETLDEAERGLALIASSAAGWDALSYVPGARDVPPSSLFGFEAALWSLRAAIERRTLPEALPPDARRTIGVAALLSRATEGILEDAEVLRRSGYRAVKLKVGGGTVEEDAALAREVAGRLGEGVALRLDANRAWNLEEAAGFLDLLGGISFEYLEEPLARSEELAKLVRWTGAPVALDESLVGLKPGALEKHTYARAVILKPTLLGLSSSLRFAGQATRLGMTPVVSAAYEGGVGTAALVALAAAVGDAPAGLDTYRRLAEDVVIPRLALPAPAIDVEEALSASCAIDRSTLRLVGEGP
jgi:o-succinylbenzoate synthase